MAFGKSPYGYTSAPVQPFYSNGIGTNANLYAQPNYGGFNPQTSPQMGNMQGMNNYQPQQPPTRTNMVFVTSLEDALQKTNMPNCNLLFLHQDKPLLFNIISDDMGKKTYSVYELKEYKEEKADEPKQEPQADFVTKEEFETYQSQMVATINKLKSIIINESAPTPTPTVKAVAPKEPVVTDKGDK